MTGPAFTMLGDADAVACTGDSCVVPAVEPARASTHDAGRGRPDGSVRTARDQEAPAASPDRPAVQEAAAPPSAPAP